MKKVYVLIALMLVGLTGLSQQTTFSKIYYDVQMSPMGNNLLACFDKGALVVSQDNYSNGILIKTDSAGTILWNKIIKNSTVIYSSLKTYDAIQTKDSNYVIAGTAYDSTISFNASLCMKVDQAGDTLWSKLIGISGHNTEAYHIEQTNDSGFVMTGFVEFNGAPYSKIFVAKLSKTGALQWSKLILGGNNGDYAYSIKQLPDSGYVVSGFTGDALPGLAFFKLSKTGNLVWTKKYGVGSGIYSYGCDVTVTASGLVVLVFTGNDAGLMKTDLSGNLTWYKTFQMQSDGMINTPKPNLVQTKDGGFVFITNACGGGSFAKCDSSGNLLWCYTPAFTANGLAKASDGGFFAGGTPICSMKSSSPTVPQIGLVKTDSLGKAMCIDTTYAVSTFNPIGLMTATYTITNGGMTVRNFRAIASSITLTADSSCTVSGGGIAENASKEGLLIYPSPASGSFNLSCTFSGNKQIEVSDLSGRVVLHSNFKTKETAIDGNDLPDGIYFVKVISARGCLIQKLVLSH